MEKLEKGGGKMQIVFVNFCFFDADVKVRNAPGEVKVVKFNAVERYLDLMIEQGYFTNEEFFQPIDEILANCNYVFVGLPDPTKEPIPPGWSTLIHRFLNYLAKKTKKLPKLASIYHYPGSEKPVWFLDL